MTNSTILMSPYKGLIPYSEEDAPFFFGREEKIQIITANLRASRLTLFHGPSGVGKSSVLRAGVAYNLRKIAYESLAEGRPPEFAVVVFSSWRDDPVASLATRVRDSVAQLLKNQTVDPLPPSRDLTRSLQTWTKQDPNDGRPNLDLLIILDQFEEYFLYHPKEQGDGTFAAELPRAINSGDLRVNFLISIREDALAKLERFKGSISQLFDNRLSLEHLDQNAAREAIIKPVHQYNKLCLVGKEPISIESALVEAVLEQIKAGQVVLSQAGRGMVESAWESSTEESQIETPYLQVVMTRLWEEEMSVNSRVLRLSTLERLGGAASIVRTHLDKTMLALTPEEQDIASRMFYHLVTPGGTKIAHTVPDLAAFAEISEEQLSPVLVNLADGRVLRPVDPPPNQPGVQRYEIFHDVLAPAILDWQSRYTLAKNQAKAEKRAAKKQLEQRAEAERAFTMERQRRMRQAVTVLSVLLVLMAFVSAYAFQQRSKANKALSQAESTKQELQMEKEISDKQREIAQRHEREALSAQQSEAAARLTAEQENQRANEQARLAQTREQEALKAKADFAKAVQQRTEAENRQAEERRQLLEKSVIIMDLILSGFDKTQAGKHDDAIDFFNHARERSHGYPRTEAYALFNVGESYAFKGGVMPLGGVGPIGTEEELKDPDVGSIDRQKRYFSTWRLSDANTLANTQKKALDSYQEAMSIYPASAGPDAIQKRALSLQRVGDLMFSSAVLFKKPDDLKGAFSYYSQAIDEYRKLEDSTSGDPLERTRASNAVAILQSRLGALILEPNEAANTNNDARNTEVLNQAKSVFESALDAYNRANYPAGAAAILVKLGDLYASFGKNRPARISTAIEHYQQAAVVYGEMKRFEKQANTYMTIASLCSRSENKCQASQKYEEARQAFQSTRLAATDEAAKTRLLDAEEFNLQIVAGLLNSPKADPQGLQAYFDSITTAYARDPSGQPGMLGAIADFYYSFEKQKAFEYYEKQRQAWERTGDKLGEGNTYLRLAQVYRNLNREDGKAKTIYYLNRAHDLYKQTAARALNEADKKAQAQIVPNLITLGSTYSEFGEKNSAFDTYDEALQNVLWSQDDKDAKTIYDLSRLRLIVSGVGNSLVDLAREKSITPQLETRAEDFFGKVFAYYGQNELSGGKADAFAVAGNFYGELGKRDIALSYFERARSSYQQTSYQQYRQYDMLERIRRLYREPPVDEATAIKYFQELVTKYQTVNDFRGEATALSVLGLTYNEAGKSANDANKRKKSTEFYEQARTAWQKANDRSKEYDVLKILSSIYMDLGQPEKAEELLKEAANIFKRTP